MSVRPSVGLHEYFPTSRGVTVARVNSETVRAAPLSVSTLIPPRAACEQCKQSKCNVKFGTQRNATDHSLSRSLFFFSRVFSADADETWTVTWLRRQSIHESLSTYLQLIPFYRERARAWTHTRTHAHLHRTHRFVDRTNIRIEKCRECGKLNKSPAPSLTRNVRSL